MVAVVRRSLTAAELAARGCSHSRWARDGADYLERLMCEDEQRGIVERDGTGWRLTSLGRQLVGTFGEIPIEDSVAA